MTTEGNLRSLLEDADPLRCEPALSQPDAESMRRAVLDASGQERGPGAALWPRALAVAALALVALAAGTIDYWGRSTPGGRPGEVASAPAVDVERRQLQFATPGGTRIIWTLDPNFRIGEMVP